MKKIILPITIVLLALCLLAGVLIYLFTAASKLSDQVSGDEETQQLEDYLDDNWPGYELDSYDEQTQTLTLCYPINKTYDEVLRYGAAAGYGELAEGHLENFGLIAYGCEENCGLSVREIIVRGVSSDGLEVYCASSADGVTACWDSVP